MTGSGPFDQMMPICLQGFRGASNCFRNFAVNWRAAVSRSARRRRVNGATMMPIVGFALH